MGKLTYVNRKIEGSKLSQVVARDIVKRIPPNVSYKTALRDPGIEFDISSKSVDDDGLRHISEALAVTIDQRHPGRVLILEEVSLKNNRFSVHGIVSLASVIRSSSSEIRNLDLSDNLIQVRTAEDALVWEQFLQSFARVTALRRLDLSGNNLGRKGFEILSKVYAAEDGFMVCEETGQATNCGLQSIPYICLANTSLDDIGATYLSYILETRKYVQELLPLVPRARPGAQTHQLEDLDKVDGCDGLIWKPNAEVHDLGVRMLELAEATRKSRKQLQERDVVDTELAHAVIELDVSGSQRSPVEKRSRGDSFLSFDDAFHITSSNTASDLIRTRSRIQLDALKNGGARQNELWVTAFKMLWLTRLLLFGADLESKSSTSATKNQVPSTTSCTQVQAKPQTWPPLPAKTPAAPSTSIATLRLVRPGSQRRPALQKGNPNASLAIKNPSSKDVTTIRISKSNHDYIRSKLDGGNSFIDCLSVETRQRYDNLYRTSLPAGFSENIWKSIIAYAADAEGVLSDNQKITVTRRGASRHSMLEVRSLRGKHESQQAYKALEAMGCLAYDI